LRPAHFEFCVQIGPPGVGKTHLSVALAEAAIRAGLGAYFITAHDLATDLGRAYREGRLDRRMRVYLAPKVLVIDEVGYLPLDDLGTTIFFQFVSARYERSSIILTSNKSYGDWGSIFGDSIIATAILDRLLHHSTTINKRRRRRIAKNNPGGNRASSKNKRFRNSQSEPQARADSKEMLYFKVYKSQLKVIEQAIETASLMLGGQKARGYCLEMICADFLAGANLEDTSLSTLSDLIRRIVVLLPECNRRELIGSLGRCENAREFSPAKASET
jgi:DNA replication protein DnaC